MLDQPPPILDDVFSIDRNSLNEILLIQLLCVQRNITMPLFESSSSPYNRQNPAPDLVRIFDHSELKGFFADGMRGSSSLAESLEPGDGLGNVRLVSVGYAVLEKYIDMTKTRRRAAPSPMVNTLEQFSSPEWILAAADELPSITRFGDRPRRFWPLACLWDPITLLHCGSLELALSLM